LPPGSRPAALDIGPEPATEETLDTTGRTGGDRPEDLSAFSLDNPVFGIWPEPSPAAGHVALKTPNEAETSPNVVRAEARSTLPASS
jgi:hypothetical protein